MPNLIMVAAHRPPAFSIPFHVLFRSITHQAQPNGARYSTTGTQSPSSGRDQPSIKGGRPWCHACSWCSWSQKAGYLAHRFDRRGLHARSSRPRAAASINARSIMRQKRIGLGEGRRPVVSRSRAGRPAGKIKADVDLLAGSSCLQRIYQQDTDCQLAVRLDSHILRLITRREIDRSIHQPNCIDLDRNVKRIDEKKIGKQRLEKDIQKLASMEKKR